MCWLGFEVKIQKVYGTAIYSLFKFRGNVIGILQLFQHYFMSGNEIDCTNTWERFSN